MNVSIRLYEFAWLFYIHSKRLSAVSMSRLPINTDYVYGQMCFKCRNIPFKCSSDSFHSIELWQFFENNELVESGLLKFIGIMRHTKRNLGGCLLYLTTFSVPIDPCTCFSMCALPTASTEHSAYDIRRCYNCLQWSDEATSFDTL